MTNFVSTGCKACVCVCVCLQYVHTKNVIQRSQLACMQACSNEARDQYMQGNIHSLSLIPKEESAYPRNKSASDPDGA